MYIIEILDDIQNWIAAVYEDQGAGAQYLEKLQENNLQFEIHLLPIEYPVYVIEKTEERHGNEHNAFIFTDQNGFIDLVREQKQRMSSDDFEVYFTSFLIDEAYFQDPVDKSQMGAIDHVHVDNYFLKHENAENGLIYNQISRLAGRWNLDGLDRLFEKYKRSGSPEQKEELAFDGYLNLFSQMHYDFACGKLADHCLPLLLPIVEKAEALLDKKLWEARSDVHIILLENAIKNQEAELLLHFQAAEKDVLKLIEEEPEKKQEWYKQLAYIYDAVAEVQADGVALWKQALDFIMKSIQINPASADWFLCLKIIYMPYDIRKNQKVLLYNEDNSSQKEWQKLRKAAGESMKEYIFAVEKSNDTISYRLALAMEGFKDHLEWANVKEDLIPENEYQYWLERAKNWWPEETTRMDVTEAGHFFHKEGKRLKRIDLLETAIRHYGRVVEKVNDNAFEIYYTASALEDIASIYDEEDKGQQAEKHLNKASAFYKNHWEVVRSNPSVLMHYTGFLERCYLYHGNIEKPTMARLKELAIITEEEGQGMYSAPSMLRVRLALLEENEDEAIFYLTRMLLLHELCVSDEIKDLADSLQLSPFSNVQMFLKDILEFMKEVAEDYYLDPEIKWGELKSMTPSDVVRAWEERKVAIRNRKS